MRSSKIQQAAWDCVTCTDVIHMQHARHVVATWSDLHLTRESAFAVGVRPHKLEHSMQAWDCVQGKMATPLAGCMRLGACCTVSLMPVRLACTSHHQGLQHDQVLLCALCSATLSQGVQ